LNRKEGTFRSAETRELAQEPPGPKMLRAAKLGKTHPH
jgi:hypothetical protein